MKPQTTNQYSFFVLCDEISLSNPCSVTAVNTQSLLPPHLIPTCFLKGSDKDLRSEGPASLSEPRPDSGAPCFPMPSRDNPLSAARSCPATRPVFLALAAGPGFSSRAGSQPPLRAQRRSPGRSHGPRASRRRGNRGDSGLERLPERQTHTPRPCPEPGSYPAPRAAPRAVGAAGTLRRGRAAAGGGEGGGRD